MGQCSSTTKMRRKRKREEEGCRESSVEKNRGCLAMVNERRSRFYIARRCVLMLLCWQKYANS
ncbi:hypothetical protein BRARA_A00267 [Brassica rapa]|uniref:Uncharacterized protein n=3 Tax=Brassica TaxID=3705 RepID=A0A398AIJ7_BRACM|nr:small polypeptide DEVIL 17-like [Brassica napus]KAG5412695.1 hypothetical protein IGI04_000262 [Brassica rapa subsp. trilocularis]RID77345.1 hypothetical protein BRARA_A00267 [Brassica rapa]CAF2146790.1 unnamed protein product [Brassica napus]CAG7886220.1 unnamed protein product [Brassica rapa]VDC73774.1 unnamed protein product [Brassica rapa]